MLQYHTAFLYVSSCMTSKKHDQLVLYKYQVNAIIIAAYPNKSYMWQTVFSSSKFFLLCIKSMHRSFDQTSDIRTQVHIKAYRFTAVVANTKGDQDYVIIMINTLLIANPSHFRSTDIGSVVLPVILPITSTKCSEHTEVYYRLRELLCFHTLQLAVWQPVCIQWSWHYTIGGCNDEV